MVHRRASEYLFFWFVESHEWEMVLQNLTEFTCKVIRTMIFSIGRFFFKLLVIFLVYYWLIFSNFYDYSEAFLEITLINYFKYCVHFVLFSSFNYALWFFEFLLFLCTISPYFITKTITSSFSHFDHSTRGLSILLDFSDNKVQICWFFSGGTCTRNYFRDKFQFCFSEVSLFYSLLKYTFIWQNLEATIQCLLVSIVADVTYTLGTTISDRWPVFSIWLLSQTCLCLW